LYFWESVPNNGVQNTVCVRLKASIFRQWVYAVLLEPLILLRYLNVLNGQFTYCAEKIIEKSPDF